jgi:hypothetical protein
VGYLRLFKTPTANPAKFPFAGSGGGAADGLVVGLTVGYDVTPRLAVALFALGGDQRASVSYGAFNVVAGGADVRVSLLGLKDANKVDRIYFYLHGRAGYFVTYPSGLFGNNGAYFAGGPGVEYFTRLRHFSVGLAADVVYVSKASTAGFAITPTVRYTF